LIFLCDKATLPGSWALGSSPPNRSTSVGTTGLCKTSDEPSPGSLSTGGKDFSLSSRATVKASDILLTVTPFYLSYKALAVTVFDLCAPVHARSWWRRLNAASPELFETRNRRSAGSAYQLFGIVDVSIFLQQYCETCRLGRTVIRSRTRGRS